ncbi:hypothetical protein TNCV_4829231 [Trichonephila clavipes]|nr:hypothetical protein TNCV_4829231 [Trichonephila clavipes]
MALILQGGTFSRFDLNNTDNKNSQCRLLDYHDRNVKLSLLHCYNSSSVNPLVGAIARLFPNMPRLDSDEPSYSIYLVNGTGPARQAVLQDVSSKSRFFPG